MFIFYSVKYDLRSDIGWDYETFYVSLFLSFLGRL